MLKPSFEPRTCLASSAGSPLHGTLTLAFETPLLSSSGNNTAPQGKMKDMDVVWLRLRVLWRVR